MYEVAKDVELTASLGWAAFAECEVESTQSVGFLFALHKTLSDCICAPWTKIAER